MKHSIYILPLAFAAALSGCAKTGLESDRSDGGTILTIEAYSPSERLNKTVLGDGGTVLWDGDESIKVFCGSASGRFTSSETLSRSSKATFSGRIDAVPGPLYAIYPYSAGIGYDTDTRLYSLTVPSVQTAVEGSFDKAAFPSVAGAGFNESMYFRNVCGGFCFTLVSDRVTKVILRGNNDEVLAGGVGVAVNTSEEPVVVSRAADGPSSITLSPSSGTFKSGVKYYISVLPTDFTKGFTVELWTADGIRYDYVENSRKVLRRSVFGRVEEMDRSAGMVVAPEFVAVGHEYDCSVHILCKDASSVDWQWNTSDPSVIGIVGTGGNTCRIKGLKPGKAELTVQATGVLSNIPAAVVEVIACPSGYTDLSIDGTSTANCYIVSGPGKYAFPAVKGNSLESVGSVSSTEVLWETFGTDETPSKGDIINNALSYKNGYIIFSTPSNLKNGNALIAAKDASDNILWSWHIWVCSGFDPKASAQVYNNDAGTMMDRNLGATSATPGDVHSLGLLYQWGRKDPFLSGRSISSSTTAKSTLFSWPTASSNSTNGTIDYATKNPTTFITSNNSNYDWYYTGSSSTDNTRWTTSAKGLYDPCPAGWRVPDGGSGGVWSKAFGTSSNWSKSSNWDSINRGMDFSRTDKTLGTSGPIWYPASGYRPSAHGSLNNVGSYGFWWSASVNGSNACRLYLNDSGSGNVYPSSINSRAIGQSVRCQLCMNVDSDNEPVTEVADN